MEEKSELTKNQGTFFKYQSHQLLIREGEVDSAVFIILKGSVHVSKNSLPDITISRLRAGSIFGEISLISALPRSTNVMAEGEVVVMKITKEMLDALEPSLKKKFQNSLIKILAQRIDEMNEKFINSHLSFY